MAVGQLLEDRKLTIDEFHRFVSQRPDHEKWELIDGEAILNATPVRFHQTIVGNIIIELGVIARTKAADWVVIPGTAVVRPDDPFNAPEPDVMVAPAGHWDEWRAQDAICVFEVLSVDSRTRDLRRKPAIYRELPTVVDYVIVSQARAEAIHYSRSNGWSPQVVAGPAACLALDGISADLALAAVYRHTPLAAQRG